jgi:hypothetical protein
MMAVAGIVYRAIIWRNNCVLFYLSSNNMRWLLFLSSLILQTEIFCQQLDRPQLRDGMVQAFEHKTALDSLYTQLELINKKTPVQESYYGMCTALYCNYDDGYMAKLKHVMKARTHLNNAVERDSKDPELRFMRLMLEHFLPGFLGLNKHIPDDLKIILANPDFIDNNPALKKKVLEFLIWCKRCTPEQDKTLQAQLDELNKNANPTAVKESGWSNAGRSHNQGASHP